MNLEQIEQKSKKVFELRKKRFQIQEEINKYVKEIMESMDKESKTKMKSAKYSLEIVRRIRRDIDFDYLDKCVADGKIPESAFKKSHYRRLLITSGEDNSGKKMVLEGNRFVYKENADNH